MNRSKIEMIKAVVMTIFAVLMLLLVVGLHDYTLVWVPILLGIFSGWFWWKASYSSRDEE